MSITNLRSSARFNQPRLVAADMHDRHPRRFEHTRDEQQSFKWHADPHSHEGHATCYQYIYTLLLKAHDGSMDCFNGNSKDPHNRHTCKMVAHAKPGLGNIDMLQVLKHYLLPRPCGSVKAHASHLPNVASPWRENDVIFVIKHPKSPNEVHSPLDLHVMLVDSLPQNAHTTAAETMIWELGQFCLRLLKRYFVLLLH